MKRLFFVPAILFGSTIACAQLDEEEDPLAPKVVKLSEREKEPGIWVMQFEYNKVKFVPVRIPGEGRKLIMYMIYRVTNWDAEPHRFIPVFELVATDTGRRYRDAIIPAALGPIRILEAPAAGTGVIRKFKSTIGIKGMIQPNLDKDVDNSAYGVVMFEEVDLESDHFTLYVKGLSNGLRRVLDKDSGEVTKIEQKTLKIEFSKRGDAYAPSEREISLGSWEFIYR